MEKAKELAEGKSDGQDGDSGEFTESREETEEGMLA